MPLWNENITIDRLDAELFTTHQVEAYVLRLDRIHPVVSGNKIFKLHYYLQECQKHSSKTILTFGGAYSNHLVATAFACRENGLRAIGVVRGEPAPELSITLKDCQQLGMQLIFKTREAYAQKETEAFKKEIINTIGDCIIIPEGGYSPTGRAGASLICDSIPAYITHICTAVGTGTTLAGILSNLKPAQQVVAVPVLKNMNDIEDRLRFLNGQDAGQVTIKNEYHFGGYAKYDDNLIRFMNTFYQEHGIATDFVYTGKLFFGVMDLIKKKTVPSRQ